MFLLQIYKALAELNAADASARKRGFVLIREGKGDKEIAIDMYDAWWDLKDLTRCLTLGIKFKGSTGYDDYRDRRNIVVDKLCQAIASFIVMAGRFEKMGVKLDEKAFDGHYYAALGACMKAVEELCMPPLGSRMAPVDIRERFRDIRFNNASNIADGLFRTYRDNMTPKLEELDVMLASGTGTADTQRKFRVNTAIGDIEVRETMGEDDPGVYVLFIGKDGTENSACSMCYYEDEDKMVTKVWGPKDPDGDPVFITRMDDPERFDIVSVTINADGEKTTCKWPTLESFEEKWFSDDFDGPSLDDELISANIGGKEIYGGTFEDVMQYLKAEYGVDY